MIQGLPNNRQQPIQSLCLRASCAVSQQNQSQELLCEVHIGICGGNIGPKALAAKVLRQCFYCPTMIDDVIKLVSTCEASQKFSHRSKAPTQPSQLITPSWPLQR
jgi:hypothetical protein